MKKVFIVLAATAAISTPAFADGLSDYGVTESHMDTPTTRSTTYNYEVGNSNGYGYGVQTQSTDTYRNQYGERDTSANKVGNDINRSVGVYVDF